MQLYFEFCGRIMVMLCLIITFSVCGPVKRGIVGYWRNWSGADLFLGNSSSVI